jgi:VCBS repeat-containing protein
VKSSPILACATSTYTLYVGSEFNQIGVSYDHAVTGNTTFTVNNITYSAGTTIPSTDLLFDVTAVDGDGDTSTTSLQVDLLGGTNVASGLTLSGPSGNDVLVGGSGSDTLTDTFAATTADATAQVVAITINGSNDAAVISGTTTGSVIEAGGVANATPGTPTATGTLADTDVDNTLNTFAAVSSPTASDGGYGIFTMTAAGVWTYTLDNANSTVGALDVGDTLTDTFTVHTVDGTAQVVTITIHGASDADPNDFDNNLATGTAVISDPPYVYGTPGHDSIAGGGDVGQIIYGGAGDDTLNGTGVNDIIYGGSGNDTIKGNNNGDDTIYGGSGNDTIHGNNGNDTIIGGFGADYLTGGNGDDRFVYLSVADSHAGQFDTITGFISGSDKINLTALGALAFLALTSTSTSVPAHTVAWLYDSASNETIVYVNPTDQTLSIGDSGLLEIHLQGIATIQASDFVHEPTTAPIVVAAGEPIDLALAATATDGIIATTTADNSLGWTLSDGALLADGTWTTQTTSVGYSFGADRDRIDLIDYARFTGSDEVRTHSTEYTDDDAAITLASGQSIELQHVHVMALTENKFVFGQLPVLDSAGVMTVGNGAVMAPSGTIHHTGSAALNAADDRAELQLAKHGMALEDGGWIGPSHSDWKINSGARAPSSR